jgi:hypothetical protein
MFLGNIGLFLDYAGVPPGLRTLHGLREFLEQNTDENFDVFT